MLDIVLGTQERSVKSPCSAYLVEHCFLLELPVMMGCSVYALFNAVALAMNHLKRGWCSPINIFFKS